MKNQLREAIDMFVQSVGKEVAEEVNSPAIRRLIEVDPECELLSENKKHHFHSVAASTS